jgi:ribosome-associated heat shock protein Hsp15
VDCQAIFGETVCKRAKQVKMAAMEKIRIDKWLWAARFYKTRSLATEEINKGRVSVNGQVVKPAREIKAGELVSMRREGLTRSVQVLAISDVRGPAPKAQLLYAETPESVQARDAHAQQRRFAREPALSIENGRPTKRDRRELEQASHPWDDRWSASL